MQSNQTASSRLWVRGLGPGIILSIGILHTIVGFAGGWDTVVDIARAGFWDAVHSEEGPPSRSLLLWFLLSGFMLIILGHLALWVERTLKQPLPAAFAVEFFIVAVIAGVLSGGGVPALIFAAVALYAWLSRKSKMTVQSTRPGQIRTLTDD